MQNDREIFWHTGLEMIVLQNFNPLILRGVKFEKFEAFWFLFTIAKGSAFSLYYFK